MELEEAILNLKETIELNNRLLDPINKQSFNKKERQLIKKENTSIEIVLQALENSIPKEVIERKIQEYQNKRNKLADGNFYKDPSNINEDMSLFVAGETLRLLLEGK